MQTRKLLLLIFFAAILISASEEKEEGKPKPEEKGSTEDGSRHSDESDSDEVKKKFLWGYRKFNGPEVWPKYFPAGKGKEQSPINIESKSPAVGFDRLLNPLKFNYKPADTFTLKNNGRGFMIEFNDKYESTVSGGPLANEYQLRRIIPHWSKNQSAGSEHLVDGQAYPSEFQFVHYNKVKYGSFDEAFTHGDGLAIVSVFFKTGAVNNRAISTFLKYLPKIVKPFTEAKLKNDLLNTAELLPSDYEKFWTYCGSLTQPPLSENSIWIIIKNTMDYGKQQLQAFNKFRKYYPTNQRPVQPLFDRVIRASFHEQRGKQ